MGDIRYVVDLAKAYERAEITRDELQDKIHSCSLETVAFGVNSVAEEFGDDAAAAFVVAAALPITYERVKGCAGVPAAYFETPVGLPGGYWLVDEDDERVRDFPPE